MSCFASTIGLLLACVATQCYAQYGVGLGSGALEGSTPSAAPVLVVPVVPVAPVTTPPTTVAPTTAVPITAAPTTAAPATAAPTTPPTTAAPTTVAPTTPPTPPPTAPPTAPPTTAAVPSAVSGMYGQTCFDGSFNGYSKDVIVSELLHRLQASADLEMKSNEKFKEFIGRQKQCQNDCFGEVVHMTVTTLAGNLGKDILKDDSETQAIANEAITGAIKTCYPSEPREDVMEVVSAVTDKMKDLDNPAPVADAAPFPEGAQCTGLESPDGLTKFSWMEGFAAKFQKAFEDAKNSDPEIRDFFQTEAKDCQKTCAEATAMAAMGNLFDLEKISDSDADEKLAIEAVTGAFKACYPKVQRSAVKAFVAEIARSFKADTTRLYGGVGSVSAPMSGGPLWFAGFVVVVGGVVGLAAAARRFKNVQRRIGVCMPAEDQASFASLAIDFEANMDEEGSVE